MLFNVETPNCCLMHSSTNFAEGREKNSIPKDQVHLLPGFMIKMSKYQFCFFFFKVHSSFPLLSSLSLSLSLFFFFFFFFCCCLRKSKILFAVSRGHLFTKEFQQLLLPFFSFFWKDVTMKMRTRWPPKLSSKKLSMMLKMRRQRVGIS